MISNKVPTKKPEIKKTEPAASQLSPEKMSKADTHANKEYPMFRKLRPEEIEIRLLDGNESGAKVFFYAKTDAVIHILDEAVGKMNWSANHYACVGVIYCRVAIRDILRGDFVGKDNAGKSTAFEPEKSAATDSFKRAAALWGVARELSDLPKIAVPFACCDTMETDGKKYIKGNGYTLRELKYDAIGRIDSFIMDSRDGKEFRWQRPL